MILWEVGLVLRSKFESDAEIGQKRAFFKGLTLNSVTESRCVVNAKESRANRLRPYDAVEPEPEGSVARRSHLDFLSWIMGGVNYWLLVAAIVLLIVIFGTPIVYRTFDEGKTGKGAGTGSAAQESIFDGQRRKISEKIVKDSTPLSESIDGISQAEATSPERPETPISETVEQTMGEASSTQTKASEGKTEETRQDASEAAGIESKPESNGGNQEKSIDEAAETANAKVEEASREKAPETSEPEAKPPEAPHVMLPTADESATDDKGGVYQAKDTGEPGLKNEESPPDIREVIVETGNVRDGPSINAEVKLRIKRGDTVRIVAQQGNWYAIEVEDGRSGWAHYTLLSRKTRSTERKEAADSVPVTKEIKAIRPVVTKDGRTGVIFELNGYYPPETQVLDGGQPRLVCDFPDTRISGTIPRIREVKNGYIKRIRIGIHDEPQPKVRVVMDFKPGPDYKVEQLFYKKENYFTLMIEPRK